MLGDKDLNRFLSKVRKTNYCWEWIAGKTMDGYGEFWYQNKTCKAPRISYMQFKGDIPDGLWVCHTCDNPGCVNPDHLFLGTHLDNEQDKKRKGRQFRPIGENHHLVKLNETLVREIRYRYSHEQITHQALADEYKVTRECITRLLAKKSWKHVM